MAIQPINETNISPVKTLAKLALAAGAAATALAAGHKADSFTKVTEKLGEKGEAVKPVIAKLDKVGAQILDKATTVVAKTREKATELEVDKKAADVAEKVKTTASDIWGRVTAAVSTMADVAEAKAHPEKIGVGDTEKFADVAKEMLEKAGQ